MTDPVWIVLEQASSEEMAQLLTQLLAAEGIAVACAADMRPDEFAMSRRILGSVGTEIRVRADHAARARALLDEWRRDAAERDAEAGDPDGGPDDARAGST